MAKVRDSAVHSSWLAPALGAGVGALVAKALQARASSRDDERHDRYERWYGRGDRDLEYRGPGYRGEDPYYGRSGFRSEDWPYQTYQEVTPPAQVGEVPATERRAEGFREEPGSRGQGLKDRAGSKLEELEGRAGEVKDRMAAKAGELEDRMSERIQSFRERLPDRARIRASTHEDTGLWALGAVALGFLFGFALPVTQRERQLLEPAKRKARELGAQAKELAVQKGSEALDQASEKLQSQQGNGGGQPEPQPSAPQGGSQESPPALH
jgi:hypothetical protein